MDCPECGAEAVAFAVPEGLREHAPADAVALCSRCLALSPAEGVDDVEGGQEADPDPDFSRVIDAFPSGEAGVATALAVGLLVDSIALNRGSVLALFERAADEGADPWLVLERLAVAGSVRPGADLERLRRQLDQLS